MQIYLVGGAVRDELLGYPVHERDYVVVGASPEQMAALGFTPIGKDFPVFLHPSTKDEYALARTERKSGRGYKGFTFNASPTITLEEDLSRRDLSINAIAKSDSGKIIDPYNGQNDLKNKCLRHLSPAFREDPVRILRVARFCARYHHLGFTIASETMQLMREMVKSGEVDFLVAERVWKEFSRALDEKNPEIFLSILKECNALERVMPELCANEDNTAALNALTYASAKNAKPALRLACLLHDSPLDKALLDQFFERLRIPKNFHEITTLVILQHDAIQHAVSKTAEAVFDILHYCDALRRPQRFEDVLTACMLYEQSKKNNFPQAEFLRAALTQVKLVDPRTLMKQGFSGQALGEKLKAMRIEKIKALSQR